MTAHELALWFAIFPVVLLGGAFVVVGALKGLRDGRTGEAFFKARPYKTWAVSGFAVMSLGFVAMVIWVVTQPT